MNTHGESRKRRRTPEFNALHGAIQRCTNPNDEKYGRYGARGISVCARWRGPDGVRNFLEDMGRRPSPQHSLDRKDNDGNYEKSNCRWATRAEQANNKSNNCYSTVRLDADLRAALKEAADLQGITVREFVNETMRLAVEAATYRARLRLVA
jgi:hypothetical protein